MIRSAIDDNHFIARRMVAKGSLSAFDIFSEIPNRNRALKFNPAAARKNVRNAAVDVDSGRLANIGDRFDCNCHSTLPLLNAPEQPEIEAAPDDSGKLLTRVNVPFLPSAFAARRTVF